MPYIDGDGQPGHFTGHVSKDGQPTGKGQLKYINGSKFEGTWHKGVKLHGRTSTPPNKKRSSSSSNKPRRSTQAVTPPPPPSPPPPLCIATTGRSPKTGRQSSDNDAREKSKSSSGSSHRSSRRDTPSRRRNDDKDNVGSRPKPKRSLSRLRRKCDEIESLLKGHTKVDI